jgi:hypothetical protein
LESSSSFYSQTRNMENKPSNLCEESGGLVEKDSQAPHCAHCGATKIENVDLLLIDQLVRSHAELSSALRWTGRQILRFEHHDHHWLEKIRGMLRRAENIRKTLNIPGDLPQDPKQAEELPLNAQAAPSQHRDQRDPESTQTKNRFSRPHSLRVIKFPAS